MNQNMYEMVPDIAEFEHRLQRLNEGRFLAKKFLDTKILPPHMFEWELIAEAATDPSNSRKIYDLENEIQRLKGEILGLKYRLDNASGKSNGVWINGTEYEPVQSRRKPVEATGMADALVSNLRQGLDLEVVPLEPKSRDQDDEWFDWDKSEPGDQLKPSEIFSIGR